MYVLAPLCERVLVVEHDSQVRTLLTTLLHQEGYLPEEAGSLEEALEKVATCVYDLVVTDLFTGSVQPHLDAARRLQQHCRPTPVGIITGWRIDQADVERAGFAFAIQKPFDLDAVLQRIAECLNHPFIPEDQQAQVIRRYAVPKLNPWSLSHLR